MPNCTRRRWRKHEIWFGERVDPDVAEEGEIETLYKRPQRWHRIARQSRRPCEGDGEHPDHLRSVRPFEKPGEQPLRATASPRSVSLMVLSG